MAGGNQDPVYGYQTFHVARSSMRPWATQNYVSQRLRLRLKKTDDLLKVALFCVFSC